MGAWFPKYKKGEYLTFGANGKNPNVKGRTREIVNYLSCLIHPIIYFCQELVEIVIAWGWEEYGKQFRIWGKPILGENHF